MPWHFRTRDVLKPPDNEAGIQPESSHAPRPAEHGDDEPARVLGGRAAHSSPVLLSPRVSSGAEKLLEERAELTVVAQYQGPDRAKTNQPLLGWARPRVGGGTAIRAVKINSLFYVLGVNLIGPALHRLAPRGMVRFFELLKKTEQQVPGLLLCLRSVLLPCNVESWTRSASF